MNDIIWNSFNQNPRNQFIHSSVFGDLTYGETDQLSSLRCNILLNEFGIQRNDKIVIISDNSVECILLVLAVWKCGAVPVLLNTRLNNDEISGIIDFVNPAAVYIQKGLIKFSSNKFRLISEDSFIDGGDLSEGNIYSNQLNDLALLIFTSGTSGKSKGVPLKFNNLYSSFKFGNDVLPQTNDDRWLASLPFYHIGGFSILTRTLFAGASIIIPSSLNTDDLIHSFKYRPTLASFVSPQFERILKTSKNTTTLRLPELRKILLGGGYIDESIIHEGIEAGWEIAKVYGSSETSSFISFLDCNKIPDKLSSAGIPLLEIRVEIRPVEISDHEENGNELNSEKEGIIWIKGNSIAEEYFNNSVETNRRFQDGWFNTGDYGYLQEGFLYLISRREDLIVSGGENINPNEIETALRKLYFIEDAVVFGEEDRKWGHIVSAALIINDDTHTSAEIILNLKTYLPSFKIPKKFYKVKSFPQTSLGKVRRTELIKSLTIDDLIK